MSAGLFSELHCGLAFLCNSGWSLRAFRETRLGCLGGQACARLRECHLRWPCAKIGRNLCGAAVPWKVWMRVGSVSKLELVTGAALWRILSSWQALRDGVSGKASFSCRFRGRQSALALVARNSVELGVRVLWQAQYFGAWRAEIVASAAQVMSRLDICRWCLGRGVFSGSVGMSLFGVPSCFD